MMAGSRRAGRQSKVNVDDLFRDVRPIQSVDELAVPEIFESDEELDEFLIAVGASRNAGLA
jgi:hypothetical protein